MNYNKSCKILKIDHFLKVKKLNVYKDLNRHFNIRDKDTYRESIQNDSEK